MLRRLLFITVGLLLACSACIASDITLTWDAMPAGQSWTAVRAYELSLTGQAYTKVGEVVGTVTSFKVIGATGTAHTYIVRSFDGTNESVDSNSVIVPALPTPPTGLKYTITVVLSGPVPPTK